MAEDECTYGAEWGMTEEFSAEYVEALPESGYMAVPLQDHYAGEEFPNNAVWADKQRKVTHYADDEERQEYAVTFVEGEAFRSDGVVMDTQGIRPTAGLRDAAPDRMIFAMDTEGTLYAEESSAWQDDPAHAGERFHHSSFLAGGDVAGAGELQVREGRVEAVSDRSGHYRPPLEATGEVITSLQEQGVQTEAVGVELSAKSVYSESVMAGALEVQAYTDPMAPDSEVETLRASIRQQLADGTIDEATAQMQLARAPRTCCAAGTTPRTRYSTRSRMTPASSCV